MYKVGDSFKIRIAEILESGEETLYRIENFSSLVFDDYGLMKLEQLEPPEVDWSKVEVGTPIMVSNDRGTWHDRKFAAYINGRVYTFDPNFKDRLYTWDYAKLAD